MSAFEKHITSDSAVAARAIVWGSGLTEQQKSDVLESTLLGQAAADKQHPSKSESDTLQWYKTYQDTLGSVGWVVQGSAFTEVHSNHARGSVDDVVLQALATDSTVDKNLYASVARAILSYSRAGEDSDAAKVFNDSSIASTSKFVSFQIAVASSDDNGSVVLTLYAFFYSSSSTVKNSLWYSWTDETDLSIKTSKLQMTLNSGIYKQVRASIHEKLRAADKLQFIVPLCE
ncbi:hypothetical protein GY45DRAFT_1376084 [Cubamyces sp. BRFM 1775]|nr:hypothetical protein GY45DRAFT_1376084 [Cubamyces sp. BRFM 1775]